MRELGGWLERLKHEYVPYLLYGSLCGMTLTLWPLVEAARQGQTLEAMLALGRVWAQGLIGLDELVRLPSEAEWEKADRGTDGRLWPWGNRWDPARCNTSERGAGGTTSVGLYSPGGDSPYEVADMVGNVWEWTRSRFKEYPYDPTDGREDLEAGDDILRVVRGGSWDFTRFGARCAFRFGFVPDYEWGYLGFRIVVSPISPDSAL